jgi:hypothetical protein
MRSCSFGVVPADLGFQGSFFYTYRYKLPTPWYRERDKVEAEVSQRDQQHELCFRVTRAKSM